jgi:hypothetical protein
MAQSTRSLAAASRMPNDLETIEKELRSLIYTTLVELSYACTEEKAPIVGRLYNICGQLNDLIVHGKIPDR